MCISQQSQPSEIPSLSSADLHWLLLFQMILKAFVHLVSSHSFMACSSVSSCSVRSFMSAPFSLGALYQHAPSASVNGCPRTKRWMELHSSRGVFHQALTWLPLVPNVPPPHTQPWPDILACFSSEYLIWSSCQGQQHCGWKTKWTSGLQWYQDRW